MSASRSSLPPRGEAEWRGGVGVGDGWARREGDENDAVVGPALPSTPAPDVDEAPWGSTPHPARASPESALPATRFASGGREVRAADVRCAKASARARTARSAGAVPQPARPMAESALLCGEGLTHLLAESPLLPLVGRTDSAEGRATGVAGHRPLGRSRPPRHQPQGQAASDPSGFGPCG